MLVEKFLVHRRALTGLAYRMLGSLPEAEDVVQDAWLRWSAADRAEVRDPQAFLVRVVTRLCLDVLGSARVRRVEHVGDRLPEPALTDRPPLGPLEAVEERETLSLALLDVLQRCGPRERAAWVLREAFGLPYDEVAEAVGCSAAAARQLYSRAARRLAQTTPARLDRPSPEQRRRVLDAFLAAAATGDTQLLAALLLEDAVVVSDGGGRATAARRPVRGADRVARFLLGITRKAAGAQVRLADAAGGPVLLVLAEPNLLTHLLEVEPAADGRISAVRIVCDPLALEAVAAGLGCHTTTSCVVLGTWTSSSPAVPASSGGP